MNSRAGISEDRDLTVVAFTDVNAVEWQVHDHKDDTTEMGTASFHAVAQLAHAEDEDKTVIATVEAPFQIGGRVELVGESFETEKPENFELV